MKIFYEVLEDKECSMMNSAVWYLPISIWSQVLDRIRFREKFTSMQVVIFEQFELLAREVFASSRP